MPIFRIKDRLAYFAHVPKCAGSSVEDYLYDRFGRLAFLDRAHLSLPEPARWSRTSPQHLDWGSLTRLFPEEYFSAIFAVVRHPVARAVSAYRFQAEVEGTVPEGMGFGEWLQAEAEAQLRHPHRSDNHSRPQVDFLPPEDGPGCAVFHLEHGLDALIPWLDAQAGDTGGPRAMAHTNSAGHGPVRRALGPVVPDAAELALVARIYAADFARFGYEPGRKAPLAPAPVLDAGFLAAAAAHRARAGRPVARLATRMRRRMRRYLE